MESAPESPATAPSGDFSAGRHSTTTPVDRAVTELRIGYAVVLVDAAEVAASAVRAHVARVAEAA